MNLLFKQSALFRYPVQFALVFKASLYQICRRTGSLKNIAICMVLPFSGIIRKAMLVMNRKSQQS
jgi:hypothetical protein